MRDLLTRDTALFLDFDGTLAPLMDDPDTVHLPEGGADELVGLSRLLGGALALVSGRDARDLSKRVPVELWRAGNHGDILLEPGHTEPLRVEMPPADLLAAARAVVGDHPGAWLEEKARVLAVHTRAAPEHEEALAAALGALADRRGDYKLQRGKDILELKPEGVHKGASIERLMARPGFHGRRPLFIGDDTTDEDGFLTAIHLGGSAIKVGPGKTLAPHRLDDHEAVWRFLKEARHDLA